MEFISRNNTNKGILMVGVFVLVFLHATESGPISTTPNPLNSTSTLSHVEPSKKMPLNSEAPEEFPDHQSQHPLVIHNSTIRDNLASHSNGTDADLDKVMAMIHGTNVITLSYNSSDKELVQPDEGDASAVLKSDVELIEDGRNTEDAMVLRSMRDEADELKKPSEEEEEETPYPVFKGQVAGILAGTFVVVSALAYLGLLSWRRYLERKYGSREMLVNEDDFVVSDDLKNFSL